MSKNTPNTLPTAKTRLVSVVVLVATMLVGGGALSAGVSGTAQAGDGPGRCCFRTTR